LLRRGAHRRLVLCSQLVLVLGQVQASHAVVLQKLSDPRIGEKATVLGEVHRCATVDDLGVDGHARSIGERQQVPQDLEAPAVRRRVDAAEAVRIEGLDVGAGIEQVAHPSLIPELARVDQRRPAERIHARVHLLLQPRPHCDTRGQCPRPTGRERRLGIGAARPNARVDGVAVRRDLALVRLFRPGHAVENRGAGPRHAHQHLDSAVRHGLFQRPLPAALAVLVVLRLRVGAQPQRQLQQRKVLAQHRRPQHKPEPRGARRPQRPDQQVVHPHRLWIHLGRAHLLELGLLQLRIEGIVTLAPLVLRPIRPRILLPLVLTN